MPNNGNSLSLFVLLLASMMFGVSLDHYIVTLALHNLFQFITMLFTNRLLCNFTSQPIASWVSSQQTPCCNAFQHSTHMRTSCRTRFEPYEFFTPAKTVHDSHPSHGFDDLIAFVNFVIKFIKLESYNYSFTTRSAFNNFSFLLSFALTSCQNAVFLSWHVLCKSSVFLKESSPPLNLGTIW